jgi:hypothetical protein
MQCVHIKNSDADLTRFLHREELTNAFKRGINIFFLREFAE